MIDRKVFFDSVRVSLFKGSLSPGQADGMNRILDEWIRSQMTDLRFLAYMLATTFHETAFTMQPVREYGSEAYLKSKPYYPWVGEGLVQVTWKANAEKFGATAPGQLMSWPLCLKPLFDGMTKGIFTGKRLADYFNNTTNDPVNARRIINGTDKAYTIANYHNEFLNALKEASKPAVVPVTEGESASNQIPNYAGPIIATSPTLIHPIVPAAPAPVAKPDWFNTLLSQIFLKLFNHP